MNCFIQKQHTSGYNSIPDAITTTTADDDDDTTKSIYHSSKRRIAMVAGVMMMLVVVAGGAVVLRWDGAASTTTTTTVEDLVVGESPGYCFYDSAPPRHCWYPTQNYHVGNWKFLRIGGRISCGPECPAPPPPPSHGYCFYDSTSLQHCWYPTQDYHVGNWKAVFDRGYHSCGPECPAPPPPTPPPTPPPVGPVYDPFHDYCFFDAYIEQFCWYPTQDYHVGDWRLHRIGGTTIDDTCGPECPPPPPPPPPGVYDPSHDWCFQDNDNPGKLCWYPIHRYPKGNWGGWDAAYGQCGDLCTDVYTPGQHDGDGPCLPATNTFGGVSETNYKYVFSNSNPFQTCYQYGDEDKYCWSNSYWSNGNNGWFECRPKGYTGDDREGWHAIKQKNMRYVNPPPDPPGGPYTCGLSIGGVGGVPCQDVYNSAYHHKTIPNVHRYPTTGIKTPKPCFQLGDEATYGWTKSSYRHKIKEQKYCTCVPNGTDWNSMIVMPNIYAVHPVTTYTQFVRDAVLFKKNSSS